MKKNDLYETEELANQYLLFHYGNEEEVLPFSFGPKNSLSFPVRCVTECVDTSQLSREAKALELGCSVGRTSFELSKHFQSVTAVDQSQSFISLAKRLQQGESIKYSFEEEGPIFSTHIATKPALAHPERIEFICQSVMDLNLKEKKFEVVMAANLLCRLPKPREFLLKLSKWTAPEGQLILISPYSWLEKYTSVSEWPDLQGSFHLISESLKDHFTLQKTLELPFLIKEHNRKYEWGVSQATIWKRK